MVIAVSTGIGLLLVNSFVDLSNLLLPILSSIFSTTPTDTSHAGHTFAKRDGLSETNKVIFGCLIPVLVLLSGLFAGLTLGYMSLDETQLNVLSMSGTP
jgi:metal transporter CNNM